ERRGGRMSRQVGSHRRYVVTYADQDGRDATAATTVAQHAGDIPPGTLRAIERTSSPPSPRPVREPPDAVDRGRTGPTPVQRPHANHARAGAVTAGASRHRAETRRLCPPHEHRPPRVASTTRYSRARRGAQARGARRPDTSESNGSPPHRGTGCTRLPP